MFARERDMRWWWDGWYWI